MENVKIYNNKNTITIYDNNNYVLYQDYKKLQEKLKKYEKSENLSKDILKTLIELNQLIKRKQKIINGEIK
jgi:parvulin-like peptidyl-prolyl isomerase